MGVAVAIVSDELLELIDTCDRIVVFYRGQIAREFIKGTDEMTPATTPGGHRGWRRGGRTCNGVGTHPTILDNLIWFILVGVFIFFVLGTDKFLTPFNIVNILSAAAVLGIVVVGQTFVLITGNFDLSQESTLGPRGAGGPVDHRAQRRALLRRRPRRPAAPVDRRSSWPWASASAPSSVRSSPMGA